MRSIILHIPGQTIPIYLKIINLIIDSDIMTIEMFARAQLAHDLPPRLLIMNYEVKTIDVLAIEAAN